jgi:hypothetical protein
MNDNARTQFAEALGDGGSDARAGSCDEDALVLKVTEHNRLFLRRLAS